MGVAGCGKSTIGRAAADRLKIPFLEGDDFHPEINITKMSQGIPLTDEDRMPWIENIAQACREKATVSAETETSLILACSALSKTVRKTLRQKLGNSCEFIYLHGDKDLIAKRLSQRQGHFFKPELLGSQFSALDIPNKALRLDIAEPIDILVKQLRAFIALKNQA